MNRAWEELDEDGKAAFYGSHPVFSALTQLGQNLFGFTLAGQLQKAFDPVFVTNQSLIAKGISPNNLGIPAENLDNFDEENEAAIADAEATIAAEAAASQAAAGDTISPGSMGFGIEGGSSNAGDPGVSGANSESSHSADGNNSGDGGSPSGDGPGEARGGVIHGISHLGDYSDGGRLLRGPGDGVSDDIPAMIGKKQPARLADGEFVEIGRAHV